ncbi:isochorismate synthase [Haloarcula rubripromontorii]|uniref:isochorismate synthase n=1 Tax=Haloarcula rubripromontorii TaxID=1705562 RepID=A0A847U588_9EURY|nr:isochorismate synthase [Haloarcula rubripromontorii]NLV06650.1 isochorismate synthase [Haloarcula rubripromontorii]
MEPLRGDGTTVGETTVVARGCRLDDAPVRAVLETDARPRFFWAAGTESIAARGSAATVTADGQSRFDDVRTALEALFDDCSVPDSLPSIARPRAFGGFAFHNGTHEGEDSPWDGFPSAAFFLPEIQVTRRDDDAWLTAVATGPEAATEAEALLGKWRDRLATDIELGPGTPAGISHRERTPTQAGWREQVSAALSSVDCGDLQKVVLAQSLRVALETDLSVPDVMARLSQTYPDCYRFMLSPEAGGTFFGATPERLVSVRGRTVRTEALAGSTGRGDTPAEDEWLAAELLDSEKDRHEQKLVADAIRDQLEPFASTVRIGDRTVRRLATVQHLRTSITAELGTDEHVLSLVEALHPTPAVGGLPPDAALRTIRETEAFDRGWYAAPIGWVDAAGNGTFAVGIRSAVATEREATLFAGAGIVADSDPDREWDEVQLKYRPILDELE